MLNKDFIEAIAGLVAKSQPPIQVDQYMTVVRKADGSIEKIEREIKPKTTVAYAIPDLVQHVANAAFEDEAEILYSRKGIRGFYSSIRLDSVTMALTETKAFAQLRRWDEKPEVLKQIDLFNLLKTTFRDCCDQALERIVKSIKWNIGNAGDAQVRQGAVSMSKSIVAEMTGAEDLNKIEYVTFTVPVFREMPSFGAKIECHIRPLPEQQCFTVIPTGEGIEQAYQATEQAIGVMIRNSLPKDLANPIGVYLAAANADNIDAPKMV